MRKSILALAALAVVTLAVAATGSASSSSRVVVTGLTVTPKPVYDDQSSLGVIFRVNRPARPGYQWGVLVFIGGKYAVPGYCSSILMSWDTKFGGNSSAHPRRAARYEFLLRGDRYGYLCRGQAWVDIVEHRIGSSAIGDAVSGGRLRFRVIAAP